MARRFALLPPPEIEFRLLSFSYSQLQVLSTGWRLTLTHGIDRYELRWMAQEDRPRTYLSLLSPCCGVRVVRFRDREPSCVACSTVLDPAYANRFTGLVTGQDLLLADRINNVGEILAPVFFDPNSNPLELELYGSDLRDHLLCLDRACLNLYLEFMDEYLSTP